MVKRSVQCINPMLPPGANLSAVLVDGTKTGTLLVKLLGETTKEKALELLTKAIEKLKEQNNGY